jgi:hypothetical protein
MPHPNWTGCATALFQDFGKTATIVGERTHKWRNRDEAGATQRGRRYPQVPVSCAELAQPMFAQLMFVQILRAYLETSGERLIMKIPAVCSWSANRI